MKKIVLGLCLIAGVSFAATAQDRKAENFPFHTISKPVQQLSYRNSVHTPASISTGNAAYVSSKGVQLINRRTTSEANVMKAAGTPSWVISKGVARMQYERNNK